MHNQIAGESVSRISRQSGHALPQHWMPSAWNRTGLSPAGVYSVFAKFTDCLQSGCIISIWPPSLKLDYTRVHTFDDLFHFGIRYFHIV